jgi:murein DD-endopeptidase MepM/ murein hydrolase activator NlpD
MNHRCGLFSLFLLMAAFSFAQDAVHVVEKGETIYSISRFYQISPGDLMKYNDITDASKLQIGRRLKIPGSAQESAVSRTPASAGAAAARSYAEYRVVKNDTFYSIAQRQGISLEELLSMNGFSRDHILREGERIKVPRDAGTPGTTTAGAVPPGAPSAGTQTRTSQAGAEVRQTTAKTVDASLRWPVKPREMAYMTGKLYGVVLLGERSESVKSLTQGTVVSAGPYRGFGRVAIVQVTGGYLYVYGGCESLSVKEGDRIGPGTELGKLGIDAVSEKPQLFFLVYRGNNPIDPAKAPRA